MNKREIKVLHIASFNGNIGDNANHQGARNLRNRILDFKFDITKKEIRKFYWKDWIFNSDNFIEEANKYDLIMIGGGNYFELWVPNSSTGTSIDLSIETLKKINTPILFYSLGCDIGRKFSKDNVKKFKKFLDFTTNNNNYYLSVRNDGAIKNIESLYGETYKGKISEIPDGGFFIKVNSIKNFELEKNKKNIVINLAGDMLEMRFPNNKAKISYKKFIKKFAKTIEELDHEYSHKLNFIFAPHIFKDLKIIFDTINQVNDKIRRNSIKTAPYLVGDAGYRYMFSLYKQADLILGTRFHANVCSYGLRKNIIGLCNYIQIKNLYQSINSSEFIEINKPGFEIELKKMIKAHLSHSQSYILLSDKIFKELKGRAKKEYTKLNQWLKINF